MPRCKTIASFLGLSHSLVVAALTATVCLNAPPVAAQSGTTTGVIRGTVRDQLGASMLDATISIQHRETDLVTTVESSASGIFVRTLPPPGTYDIIVKAATEDFGLARRVRHRYYQVGD